MVNVNDAEAIHHLQELADVEALKQGETPTFNKPSPLELPSCDRR